MAAATREPWERASKIRIVLLDVDGVLSDGRLTYDAEGRELKTFDVRDGCGIRLGQQAGLLFAIISGRSSGALAARASELDIAELHMGVRDKVAVADKLLASAGLSSEQACFVGDDVIDVPLLRKVGLAVAPADAVAEVAAVAHWVTRRPGGRGAVREVLDLVLRAAGHWDEVVRRYQL